MSRQIRILSIDGGGIRGIIPGVVLAEIEQTTGKPIAELFDLIAGTSTGGILALGLTMPGPDGKPLHSAASLVKLYEGEGMTIFPPFDCEFPLPEFVESLVARAAALVEEKYSSEGLERVLHAFFGDARLRDALTDVLVTAYDIERRAPFFFKSWKARTQKAWDFPACLAARATAAAPTYFEPVKLPADDPYAEYYALIDGGVFANNPTLCAYVEARRLYPEAEDMLVVSLGTGELIQSIPYEKAKDWGLIAWALPVLNIVRDGVSTATHNTLRRLLPYQDHAPSYVRFQTKLDVGTDALDRADRSTVRMLKLQGEAILRDEADTFERLCKLLKS